MSCFPQGPRRSYTNSELIINKKKLPPSVISLQRDPREIDVFMEGTGLHQGKGEVEKMMMEDPQKRF